MLMIYQPAGRAREYAEWACNIYRGCDHDCTYCYAPAVLRMDRAEFHADVQPRGDLLEISNEATRLSKAGNTAPILLCFTCDPYSPGAISCVGWTRTCIHEIHDAGQRVTILSKGGRRALADLDILGPGDEFATTLTLHHPEEWEPHSAPTRDRIEALWAAQDAGLRTWASFEPVLDPAQTLELIEEAAPYLSLAKVGIANHIGLHHDWADFGRRAEALCQSLGLDYLLKHDLRQAMEQATS